METKGPHSLTVSPKEVQLSEAIVGGVANCNQLRYEMFP